MKVKLIRPVYAKFGVTFHIGEYEAVELKELNRFQIKHPDGFSCMVDAKKVKVLS